MDDPKVSIIMPVYNAAAYVGQAIQSVLEQSHTHWELLVINDGSEDHSEKIIKKFVDSRIHYFVQENRGVSCARNQGLEVMSGDFLCFLDADDVFPVCSLESRLQVFEDRPELHFVDGVVESYDVEMHSVKGRWAPEFSGEVFNELITLSGSCFRGPTWMIRNDSTTNHRFLETVTHGEDLLFYLTVSQYGGLYHYTSKTIYKYRTGNDSAMSNLFGLEQGYFEICQQLKNFNNVTSKQALLFKNKTRSILLKSFLSQFRMLDALRMVLKWQKL